MLVALVVVAGAGYGGYVGLKTRLLATPVPVSQAWFAPYVDVTLTPAWLPCPVPLRHPASGAGRTGSSHVRIFKRRAAGPEAGQAS